MTVKESTYAYVETRFDEPGVILYRAQCERCNWQSADMHDPMNAKMLLGVHRNTRAHKTNVAGRGHRFSL